MKVPDSSTKPAAAWLSRLRRFVRAALAHGSRQLLAMALALGLLRWLSIPFAKLVDGIALERYVWVRLPVALAMSLVFLLAVLLAEQRVREGGSRVWSYLVAVVLASIVGGLLGHLIFAILGGGRHAPGFYRFAYYFTDGLMRGGMAAVIYSNYQRLRQSRHRLHEAELERAEAGRKISETRLQALQARVDLPQLFGELARVRDLYSSNPRAADTALDALAARLRIATQQGMP